MTTITTWASPENFIELCDAFAFDRSVRLVNAAEAPVDRATGDGILLAGGVDISGQSLRQPVPHPSPIISPDPRRDKWDFAAAEWALKTNVPLFAICRGFQVLNVVLGGTLHLDIPGHTLKPKGNSAHGLVYAAGIPAWRTFSTVNSTHHQAVDRLGDELTVEAWSTADRIIEQTYLKGHRWCHGVQYHPERGAMYQPLLEQFIHAMRNSSRQ